ncbi:hypothetical protein BT67DRAFT_130757 [Trichocladium antarcticum]|uniref:Uncharacterized protein n=1 Tax=Trichocladium antarcticum TaxID=1450529 RepID=A0AAN6ZHV4_9PEZI|nr:hypothetical protein BT67DRAFT_130757 [Trichocladium antarcticum]
MVNVWWPVPSAHVCSSRSSITGSVSVLLVLSAADCTTCAPARAFQAPVAHGLSCSATPWPWTIRHVEACFDFESWGYLFLGRHPTRLTWTRRELEQRLSLENGSSGNVPSMIGHHVTLVDQHRAG